MKNQNFDFFFFWFLFTGSIHNFIWPRVSGFIIFNKYLNIFTQLTDQGTLLVTNKTIIMYTVQNSFKRVSTSHKQNHHSVHCTVYTVHWPVSSTRYAPNYHSVQCTVCSADCTQLTGVSLFFKLINMYVLVFIKVIVLKMYVLSIVVQTKVQLPWNQ